jgi:hypothetical protein
LLVFQGFIQLSLHNYSLGYKLSLQNYWHLLIVGSSRVQVPRHIMRHVARLVVDYFASPGSSSTFAYAARPGASAPRTASRRSRAVSPLDFSSVGRPSSRRAPGCSVSLLDYSVCGRCDFVLRPHWLHFSHAMRRDYLSRGNTGSTSNTLCATVTSSSSRIASTIHLD